MSHYGSVKSETTQKNEKKKQKINWNRGNFFRDLRMWGFALVISFLPFLLVYLFFTGPKAKFCFWELFRDYALFYVCVTMSALSLCTYERMIKGVMFLHIFVLLIGMAIYFLVTNGVSIPLFDILDYRKFIFSFFLFSVSLGLGTVIHSSVRKGV